MEKKEGFEKKNIVPSIFDFAEFLKSKSNYKRNQLSNDDIVDSKKPTISILSKLSTEVITTNAVNKKVSK